MDRWTPAPDPAAEVEWLVGQEDELTGYWAPVGFEDSTWILHAMYQNAELDGLGTHDDVEKELVRRGLRQPDVLNGVDLTATTVDSGTPLGFVERPGAPWVRKRWRDVLGPGLDREVAVREHPPTDSIVRGGRSWPAAVVAPPEGSLDQTSLEALVEVLSAVSDGGSRAEVVAFYGQVPANDYERPTVFTGALGALRELTDGRGQTPSNVWPVDRSWFVLTDWDITSTCVWGTRETVDAVRRHPDLETAEWTREGEAGR